MNAQDLRDRLFGSAEALGWPAAAVQEFTQPRFRGRTDESSATLPSEAYGMRLGAYPVIVAPVALGGVNAMRANLRPLHSQMVIARSYMRPEEVINSHLLLCAVDPVRDEDWRNAVDFAERDENVCRKIVWIPDSVALDASYDEFLARTFMATPWFRADERLDASLDSNQGLAQRVLTSHGLSSAEAARWVEIVNTLKSDPEAMVAALSAAERPA
ncbi:ABC-three component system middle component 1 [Methylobacterium sp. A52T]